MGAFDYTLVSGPYGPHNAEIRHAFGVTTPTAQSSFSVTFNGFGLAGRGGDRRNLSEQGGDAALPATLTHRVL